MQVAVELGNQLGRVPRYFIPQSIIDAQIVASEQSIVPHKWPFVCGRASSASCRDFFIDRSMRIVNRMDFCLSTGRTELRGVGRRSRSRANVKCGRDFWSEFFGAITHHDRLCRVLRQRVGSSSYLKIQSISHNHESSVCEVCMRTRSWTRLQLRGLRTPSVLA